MIGSPGIGMLEFCIALSEGYLEKDDAIIFVAMDTSPTDVISMMETFGLPMDELLGKRIFFLDYHSCLLGSNMDRSDCIDGVRTISDLEGIMFNVARHRGRDWKEGEGILPFAIHPVPLQPIERGPEVLPDKLLQDPLAVRHRHRGGPRGSA